MLRQITDNRGNDIIPQPILENAAHGAGIGAGMALVQHWLYSSTKPIPTAPTPITK